MTDKQKRFCEEYVIDWNATRAAKEAGYSEDTARSIGNENLTKPDIAEYIEEIQQDLAKLAGVSALQNINTLKGIILAEDPKNSMRAIEIINRMVGLNAPEEQKINLHQEQPLFPESSSGAE